MDKAALEALLKKTVDADAGALHLVAGNAPVMRSRGRLVRIEQEDIERKALEQLSKEFLFEDHRQKLQDGEEVEFLYKSSDNVRFRTVVMNQSGGLSLAFHRIPTTIPTLDGLGIPPMISSFTEFQGGLVVLTGFLGSGKSASLAALVNHVNTNQSRHIVCVERPIEYIHTSDQSLVHQREVGFHVQSFAAGVREATRHGADVIVVGELRDAETMEAVLDAADRGILVLTTLHASSVTAAMAEMQGCFGPDDRARFRSRLAGVLRVVMAQTLLNRIHNKGKIPLLEILINSPAMAKVIRSGQLQDIVSVMERNRGLGMQTNDMGLRDLLNRNLISEEEAGYHAQDRELVLLRRGLSQSAPV